MAEPARKDNLRLILSLIVGLAIWCVCLMWYLHSKRTGSYSLAFLAFNAPGVPGGFVGYWAYRLWGDESMSGTFYRICELGLPSLSICLTWVNLCYQCPVWQAAPKSVSAMGRYKRLVYAMIPFLIGWCTIPFVMGKLAG